jgi:glycerophosphoryl diester phosphodiesterase
MPYAATDADKPGPRRGAANGGLPEGSRPRGRRRAVRAGGISGLAATLLVSGALGTVPAEAASVAGLQVVAHRGGTVWGPELTLATFRHAAEVGSDAVEVDVRFTKDGYPVVLHDDTLDRTTNCSGPVSRITLRQLQHCDAGSWYRQNPIPGERVPTLHDALRTIKQGGMKAYIHVKQGTAEQARVLVETADLNGMNTSRTTWISDWESVLKNLRKAGAKRLGYSFHDASGWNADYPVLIAYDTVVTRAKVQAAQRRGVFVGAVQGHPVSTSQVEDLKLDAYVADDLDAVLERLDRLDEDTSKSDEDRDEKSDKKSDGRDNDKKDRDTKDRDSDDKDSSDSDDDSRGWDSDDDDWDSDWDTDWEDDEPGEPWFRAL